MNVKLFLHDGSMYTEEVENFDLESFIEQINTEQHKMIKFGTKGIMKSAVKMVDANPLPSQPQEPIEE